MCLAGFAYALIICNILANPFSAAHPLCGKDLMIVLTYVASWLGLVGLGILNILTREKVYGNLMRAAQAGRLSMVIGFFLSGPYIWLLSSVVPIMSGRWVLLITAMWFVMAIMLESLDLFVAGRLWRRPLRHYDLFGAKLWALMLLCAWALHL